MHVRMHVHTYARTHARTYAHTHVRTYVCMYVCIQMPVFRLFIYSFIFALRNGKCELPTFSGPCYLALNLNVCDLRQIKLEYHQELFETN